ncbi:MAG TPA: tetratricopeptide repeat protein [Ktedonobacterales bacterium]|nr:tetratricopeptide repeat protein [Ktedonobacterales bacterium]
MSSPRAPRTAPRGARSPAAMAALIAGWLLLIAWIALVAWNASTVGLSAPLARLIALPTIPTLALSPEIAAQSAMTLAGLMPLLLIVLVALSFIAAPRAATTASVPTRAPAAEPLATVPPVAEARVAEPVAPTVAVTGPAEDVSVQKDNRRAVFISHASGDNDFGKALTDWLRAALGPDWVVWYDSHGEPDERGDWPDGIPPASDWMKEIQRRVLGCDVFVVIQTEAAMASYWVQKEIELAWTRKPGADVTSGLVVVPVLRETCEVPALLGLVQYIDYQPGADEARAQRSLLYAVRSNRTIPVPYRVEIGPPFDLSVLRPADHFFGREGDVAWVMERLTGPADAQLANIAAANGQGGIGKTALAAEVVKRLMAGVTFRDGIGAVDCRDKHSDADALGLLQTVLSRFTPGRQKPDDADFIALADVARTLFAGKRVLVVLDNVEADLPASNIVTPLRTAGAAVLLTSRTPLAAAQGASIRLDRLPETDALDLFASIYGRALSDAEREDARRIVLALGRHTLAVRLAAANAANQGIALRSLANDFERNPLRDAWLKDSEAAVTYVLASSAETLTPGGRRLFAALGGFATADVGRMAALALAQMLGDDENGAELGLRGIFDLRLADSATIELPGEDADRDRLRLHPLTQAYASDLFQGRRTLPAAAPWDDAQRERVNSAIAAWYANHTNRAPGLALTPDEANIIGALDWALAAGDDDAVARICNGMRGFWRDTGRTRAGLRYLPLGAAAAGRIADASGERQDRLRQAYITGYLGDLLQNTGRLDDAEAIFLQDLDLRRSIEDRQGQGVVLSRLGQVALSRGRLEEAAEYFAQSLPIDRETQDRQGEGVDLSNLGQVALRRGRLEEAADYFAQSLPIRRETQDRRGEGVVLATLGQLAEARGEFAQAAQAYADGIEALREVGDRINVAAILEALGAVLLRHLADRAGGRAAFAEAIALWQEIGLADREDQARERAIGLGCDEQDLPPPRNAGR